MVEGTRIDVMIEIVEDISFMPEGWTGHLVGSKQIVQALEKIHARRPFTSLLEFGFNSGWSSVLFLTLFPRCRVTSIEINRDTSAEAGVEEINKRFPGRHTILWKDSTSLHKSNFESKEFDAAFIDGGHTPTVVDSDITLSKLLGIQNFLFDDGDHENVMPGIKNHSDLKLISTNPYDIIRFKNQTYRRKGRTSSIDHYQIF